MERLFVDTSAWLDYINRGAPDHDRVADAIDAFEARLVTTNFVLAETVTLCRRRLSHPVSWAVGEMLRDPDVVDLVRLTSSDENDAWNLFGRRPDKRYSFTDCTSFVVMRRLGLERVAALDADFAQEGFIVVP